MAAISTAGRIRSQDEFRRDCLILTGLALSVNVRFDNWTSFRGHPSPTQTPVTPARRPRPGLFLSPEKCAETMDIADACGWRPCKGNFMHPVSSVSIECD